MNRLPAQEAKSKRPAYKIVVDGLDVTGRFQDRAIQIALTDKRGMEADELTISASDHDGALLIPRRDAKIELHIGWEGDLVYKGRYQVDEVTHDGPPDRLTVRARSADMRTAYKVRKERSWDQTPVEDLINKVAFEHDLTPVVDPDLGGIMMSHEDQTHESDAHFLTRLGQRYDAIATVKDQKLLFMCQGKAQTSSGKAIPGRPIDRGEVDGHQYQEVDRETHYTGVVAEWQDHPQAKRQTVTAGTEETPKVLPKPYATERVATDAAEAEWRRLQRGKATFSCTLSHGDPRLIAETPVPLTGWKAQITDHDWIAREVVHTVGENGFTTRVELEVRGDE